MFQKTFVSDIISKSVVKIKIREKYKIIGMFLIFQKNIFANTDLINKWNTNEYDSFTGVIFSINHK